MPRRAHPSASGSATRSPRTAPAATTAFRDQRIAGSLHLVSPAVRLSGGVECRRGAGLERRPDSGRTPIPPGRIRDGDVSTRWPPAAGSSPRTAASSITGAATSRCRTPRTGLTRWDIGLEWQIRREMELVARVQLRQRGERERNRPRWGCLVQKLRRRRPALSSRSTIDADLHRTRRNIAARLPRCTSRHFSGWPGR